MLVIGRALHAVGILANSGPVRSFGMIFTYLALLGAAGELIAKVAIMTAHEGRRADEDLPAGRAVMRRGAG